MCLELSMLFSTSLPGNSFLKYKSPSEKFPAAAAVSQWNATEEEELLFAAAPPNAPPLILTPPTPPQLLPPGGGATNVELRVTASFKIFKASRQCGV